MATPVVSSMLALMQEHLRARGINNPSPALMKALLINGARSIGQDNLQVRKVLNRQGWGLASITNSLPLHSPLNLAEWPVRFFDQEANGLITGESAMRKITMSSNSPALRISLVWTDPPGNPSVGSKLVNDLDLIVTNETTGEIFVGNAIAGDFNAPIDGSNIVATVDRINNVENVYIRSPQTNQTYSVTVRARRVNVNAITAHDAREVAQDYALVISSGSPAERANFTVVDGGRSSELSYEVRRLTNGVPVLREMVGANPSQWTAPNSNGFTNQWRFFVFENTSNNVATNVAFFAFITPNLSRVRQSEEADIDLYVSTLPALTNLDATVIANARTSRKRGGTEAVVFTNATDRFFYIGVKSEDQQAALFGLAGFATDRPFSQTDSNGVVTVNGLGVPVDIPDGSSEDATPVYVFGYCLEPIQIRNAVVTNVLTHQTGGDLVGVLDHNGRQSVLNNHRSFQGTNLFFIYDDSDSGQIPNSTPTDPPGSLRNFWGEEGEGAWQLTMVDNALSGVGRVEGLSIRLEPAIPTNDTFSTVVILPNRWFFTVADVPADAIGLTIDVIPDDTVDVYVSRNRIPSQLVYDHYAQFEPPGGSLTITPADNPPLNAGLYIIGLFNPTPDAILVRLRIRVLRHLAPAITNIYRAVGPTNLLDDAVTTSLITVTNAREVADVRVGVRIRHERASDLVLSLVSPAGTRIILAENRGGDSTLGYGGGSAPNYVHTIFTDNTNLTITPIKFGIPPFTNSPTPNSNALVTVVPTGPPIFSGFEDPSVPCNTQLNVNDTVDGWEVFAGSMDLLCTGPRGTAYFGQKWIELNGVGPGMISRRVPTVAGTDYQLTFAYSKNVLLTNAEAQIEINRISNSVVRFDSPNSTNSLNWQTHSTIVRGTGGLMDVGFRSRTLGSAGMYIDNVQFVPVRVQTNVGNYFLPEEPLRELRGENAYGIWRLEIWDNRVGGLLPELLDWQVDFDFANPGTPTIVLTNGQCFTNTIEGAGVRYFRVDVPLNATRATNTFSASRDLSMSADATTLPTGFSPPDDYSPVSGTGGTMIITTASVPPLRPGRSYFVGLRNMVPFDTNGLAFTNAFTFCVEFDEGPTNDLAGVVVLTNNTCITSSIESTNLISYYMFDASSNAVAVFFDLVGLDGNADLFVKRGLPLPFPGNSFQSRNTGTTSEHIAVGTGQIPGRWFIGVLNNDVTNLNYTLCVRELTNYTTITNSLCWTNGIAPNETHYYRFTISNATGRAEFRTFNAVADIDLYLRKVPPASEFAFDYASQRRFSGDESIVIDLLSTPVPLTSGDWYVAVVNHDGFAPTDYCIEVNQYPYFDPGSVQLFITNGWTDVPPPERYMDLTLIGPDYLRYQIEYSDTLTDDPASWRPFTDLVSGQPISFGPGSTMYTYHDAPLMSGNPPGLVRMRFYRVRVVP
jgi:subtilisin-like proprotein convertase family protein